MKASPPSNARMASFAPVPLEDHPHFDPVTLASLRLFSRAPWTWWSLAGAAIYLRPLHEAIGNAGNGPEVLAMLAIAYGFGADQDAKQLVLELALAWVEGGCPAPGAGGPIDAAVEALRRAMRAHFWAPVLELEERAGGSPTLDGIVPTCRVELAAILEAIAATRRLAPVIPLRS